MASERAGNASNHKTSLSIGEQMNRPPFAVCWSVLGPPAKPVRIRATARESDGGYVLAVLAAVWAFEDHEGYAEFTCAAATRVRTSLRAS